MAMARGPPFYYRQLAAPAGVARLVPGWDASGLPSRQWRHRMPPLLARFIAFIGSGKVWATVLFPERNGTETVCAHHWSMMCIRLNGWLIAR